MQQNSLKTSIQSRHLQTQFRSLGTLTPLPHFRIFPKKSIVFFKPFPILNYSYSSIAMPNVGSWIQNFPRSQNFYFLWFFHKFPYVTIFLLVLHYNSGKQIARGGWSGFEKALSGNHPTGFGLYPTSNPPRVIVQKCRNSNFTQLLEEFTLSFSPKLLNFYNFFANLKKKVPQLFILDFTLFYRWQK